MIKTRINERYTLADGKGNLRIHCVLDDGSVYSCNQKFQDWRLEGPATSVLAEALDLHRGNLIRQVAVKQEVKKAKKK